MVDSRCERGGFADSRGEGCRVVGRSLLVDGRHGRGGFVHRRSGRC